MKFLYDVETYPNFFCVALENLDTHEKLFFEISEEKDDRLLIFNWFNKYNKFLIHFNGHHYDNILIKFILKDWNKLKNISRELFNLKLKEVSDAIIDDNYDKYKWYKYYKTNWIDVDLFLYWAKMLRISKKISLKGLAIQLNYPVVQELPFPPNIPLKIENLPILRHYNAIHDISILRYLEEKMNGDIQLRRDIKKDFGLDCYSWDAIKIASEALLDDYCKTTFNWDNVPEVIYGTPFDNYKNEVRKRKHVKHNIYFNDILKDINPNFQLPIFQKFYKRLLTNVNTFFEELIVNENNTSIKISYGIGGVHTINSNERYFEDEKFYLITSDISSLYPTNIINYKLIRYPEVLDKYISIKEERIIAKKNKEKGKDTFFKLILNGTSGLIDNEYSWLYYPEGAMKLRLIGQIILTKLAEECMLKNWKVISMNTDGIEALVPKSEINNYYKTVNKVEKMFNVIFEHDFYKQITYLNVNNYIAETTEGKLKKKGCFKYGTDIPLGDNVDEQIIAICLEKYYINNIKPEEVLNNLDKYNISIYDFCKSNKISKDYVVYHNNTIQQQLNRYYFSKSAPYLFKKKKTKTTMEHVNVGEGVILFNNYEKKEWEDYNINYTYYLNKIYGIINTISNNNQLSLF